MTAVPLKPKPMSAWSGVLRHETILAVLLAVALAVLASRSDRFFTRRQPAQPGPADDGGRA